jgi:hypothetical protein
MDSAYQEYEDGLDRFFDVGFGSDIGEGQMWSHDEPRDLDIS